MKLATEEKRKQGKKNRASGAAFELKVRKDLEENGWIVDKWTNNVDWLEDNINRPPEKREGKLIQAKSFMGKTRTNGFPDFIAINIMAGLEFSEKIIKLNGLGKSFIPHEIEKLKEVIGVESKSNGYLKPEEKEKCSWYLKNKVFSKILIAKKGKKRGEIEYVKFSS